MSILPSYEEIAQSLKDVGSFVQRTPILTSSALDTRYGARLFFKCENFQRAGAFKFRGAINAIMRLPPQKRTLGVATHSSGNHGGALALAAQLFGIPAHIVMPEDAPRVKVAAAEGYGATITFCAPTLQAREETLAEVLAQTDSHFVHPYNDRDVVMGQGTCALEFFRQMTTLAQQEARAEIAVHNPAADSALRLAEAPLDLLLCPVGGGGLMAGSAVACRGISPKTRVIACEPEGADDAYRSFQSKTQVAMVKPNTVADGLKTSIGDLGFSALMTLVDDVLLAPEKEILPAQQFFCERTKAIIEPSSAVPLAALSSPQTRHKLGITQNTKIGVIVSGGNADLFWGALASP